MLKEKKLLIVVLIFLLTFSYFAEVTQAIAAGNFVSIFAGSSGNVKNIEFDAGIKNGESVEKTVISDVNNDELLLGFDLEVKEDGYLKNAQIELVSSEKLNFEIVSENESEEENEDSTQETIPEAESEATVETVLEDEVKNVEVSEVNLGEIRAVGNSEVNEQNNENEIVQETAQESEKNNFVQKIDEYTILLNKINFDDGKINFNIPIKYENEEFVNLEKLDCKFTAKLTGIYVDEDGKDNNVSKEVELELMWNDNRTVSIESQISKYIQFGTNGLILQNIIKVNSKNENKNSLPIKETELNVDIPTIANTTLNSISVVANSTKGTNGKNSDDNNFSIENWNYNDETKRINIKVTNPIQRTNIVQEDYTTIEEERYYNSNEYDEYVITYIFSVNENVTIESKINIATNIEAKVSVFNGDEKTENINVVNKAQGFSYEIANEKGNIVSTTVENETTNVSKIYGYLNNGEETSYVSNSIINIAYTDSVNEIYIEDAENYYTDKNGKNISTNDLYYKTLTISRESFNEILGEEGSIEILDKDGNLIFTINHETQLNENENYILRFNEKMSNIKIKIVNPVKSGNLVIKSERCMSNISVSKEEYANIKSVTSQQNQKVKFDFLDEAIALDPIVVTTVLDDTYTDATLTIDKDNFSTVKDTEVEMIVALNNHTEKSDIYGTTSMEIEMPKYVKKVQLTDWTLTRGEGLVLSDIKSEVNENGRTSIKIDISGKQNGMNSGTLTNGTNLILKCTLSVDKYTPTVDDCINLYTYNSEATNYKDEVIHKFGKDEKTCGVEQTKVTYKAPSGVVSINTAMDYNNSGDTVSSIDDETRIGKLDIYSDAQNAKIEMAVMNNTESNISNVEILGRFPFSNVADVETNEPLGANVDCKVLSKIAVDSADFKVYYSTNKVATKDLSNAENGWVEDIADISEARSYLIVATNSEYVLNAKKSVAFSYNVEIPEQLGYNKSIYSTFATYYKDSATGVEEISRPNNILLTTGNGPEMEMSMSSEVENNSIAESEEFNVKINVKNSGSEIAQNILLTTEIVKNASYVSAVCDRENVVLTNENNVLKATVDQMSENSSFTVTLTLKAGTKPSDGSKIDIKSTVTADKLGKNLEAEINNIDIIAPELKMTNILNWDAYYEEYIFDAGIERDFVVRLENQSSDVKRNIVAVSTFPKEIKVSDIWMFSADGKLKDKQLKNFEYDENSNTITWKIDKMDPGQVVALQLVITTGKIDKEFIVKDTYIKGSVTADETEKCTANEIMIKIGRPQITITQTCDRDTNEYLKVGDKITYIYTIKNEGTVEGKSIKLIDKLPEGIKATEIYRLNGDEKIGILADSYNEISLCFNIFPNEKIVIYVEAIVENIGDSDEKTISNYGVINGENVDEIITDPIIHFIIDEEDDEKPDEEDDKEPDEEEQDDDEQKKQDDEEQEENKDDDVDEEDEKQEEDKKDDDSNNSSQKVDINETSYKNISGLVWIDSDKDGIRDDNEAKLSNITVSLIKNNTVVKNTTTDSNGQYTFSSLVNGDYLIIFKYDTDKYSTTTYRKANVADTVNSDAYAMQIERNGKSELCGVTDTITLNNNDITNIDMGLIESAKFSLKLDNAITKVTVENKKGTTTTKYDNLKLAKCEIGAKYLTDSTVYIEYTLTVTNNGDLTGFASEIIDYVPTGLTFNSSINSDWYSDSDGNLHTKATSSKELAPGESTSVTLVLMKKMTNDNTGLVSNTAEIAQIYNIYGQTDSNSTPANKAQNEDDISTADIIITVRTGRAFMYTSVSIIFIMIGITGGLIYFKTKKEQGGEF